MINDYEELKIYLITPLQSKYGHTYFQHQLKIYKSKGVNKFYDYIKQDIYKLSLIYIFLNLN